VQWRRQDCVTGGGSEVWVYRGLEYEVPQSRLYCLCINVALCSTDLQCICRVTRRSSMTVKAHTYYIIFGRPPIGGKLPSSPLAAPLVHTDIASDNMRAATMHQCQQCMRWARQATARAIYRLGQKSKLLILSERVNNTEKTGGMRTNTNSYGENGAATDIFTRNILRHNV